MIIFSIKIYIVNNIGIEKSFNKLLDNWRYLRSIDLEKG